MDCVTCACLACVSNLWKTTDCTRANVIKIEIVLRAYFTNLCWEMPTMKHPTFGRAVKAKSVCTWAPFSTALLNHDERSHP